MLASKDTRRVTLSFMSDPFQPCEEQYGISCAVVRALKKANIPVDILTKGGHRAESALPFLGVSDAVGTTLTFSQADKCAEWEPGAAPPRERAAFLKAAKEAGIQTWVSIEPVIDTQESLECIRRTAEYVDKYKVGRLNHMTNTTDWRQFTQDAFALLTTLGKKYMFKHDLRPYLLSGQAAQQD
jgi:DNA repair photolyase